MRENLVHSDHRAKHVLFTPVDPIMGQPCRPYHKYNINTLLLYSCADLWLGYIEMELSFPGGLVENVAQLHWKAIKELKSELTADFISQYSLMHSKSAVLT